MPSDLGIEITCIHSLGSFLPKISRKCYQTKPCFHNSHHDSNKLKNLLTRCQRFCENIFSPCEIPL
ncbi:hypothetical protein Barb4_00012 [Bacteroidales bacterium Barb4]|nr:hypothetical protein Barb4_00012 [Bacteroidales bacterium Barb4]